MSPLTLRSNVEDALGLLTRRDRRVLYLVVGLQLFLALLDLVGIALLGVVAALATAGVSGSVPSSISGITNRMGLADVDTATLALALALIAGVFLVSKSLLSFAVTRRVFRFLANRQAEISGRLAGELLRQPLLFIQLRSSQQTAYALTSGSNAATLGVLGSAVVIASELALIVVLGVGLAFVDILVTAFTLVFFVILGLVLHRILAEWAGRLGRQASSAEIASYSSVQEVMRTYREVTVTSRRRYYTENFQNLRWQAASVQADMQVMGLVSKYAFEVALIVGGGLLAVSQFYARDTSAAVAVIAIFLAAASRIMPSLLRMQSSALSIRSSAGAANLTFELARELGLSKSTDLVDSTMSPGGQELVSKGILEGFPDFLSDINIDDVTLRYPSASSNAIEGISIRVKPGTSLALVGSTGSGKTTLADLILGILIPEKGRIRIGGLEPAVAISRSPGALTYVPQDIAVISGSIRDNVALGLPGDLTIDDRIWESLDRAHLGAFLRENREGLDTVVGEHGMRLSGGQRQRLGLARALYSRPSLIVLDEATSALDAETEESVSKALTQLEGKVTLVIVAHRLATIRNCDQVAYLSDGRVKAVGSFQQVRDQVPEFDHQAVLLGL